MSTGKIVHRNFVGSLEVPDWEAYATELQEKAPHDASARSLLAGLCREFPELRARFPTDVITRAKPVRRSKQGAGPMLAKAKRRAATASKPGS